MELPEWAWAAGLFEGEGCIFLSGRQQPGASLAMCDEDVVRRFASVVGVGRVNGPYAGQETHHKPTWTWCVRSWSGVAHVLIGMAPWLGARRRAKGAEVMSHRPLDSWLPGYTRRLQTHCVRGHELTPQNIVTAERRCRTCRSEARKKWLKTPAGREWRKRSRAANKTRRAEYARQEEAHATAQ